MPLIKSASKEAISSNIRAEMAAGKPQKQAIAIALDVARRARRKAGGGAVDELVPPPRTPTQMPEEWNEAVRSAAGRIANTLAAPGRAMQGGYSVKPTVPGLWSEEDEFRQQHAQRQQAEDAAALALDVAQARFPFAKSGEAGVFGGKLKQPGIKAYHGSPHDFDRFDMSKIGTGEGAQAYGHGLYFAQNEAVARQYRNLLSTRGGALTDAASRAQFWTSDLGSPELAIKHLEGVLQQAKRSPKNFDPADLAITQQSIDYLKGGGDLMPKGGKMYEVNINAHPDQFLDWDKPLSGQGSVINQLRGARSEKVRDAIADPSLLQDSRVVYGTDIGPATGSDIYKRIALATSGGNVNGTVKTTDALRRAGIPGIKYLDQGSRPNAQVWEREVQQYRDLVARQTEMLKSQPNNRDLINALEGDRAKLAALESSPKGTRNYVVFDDKLIDILKKYGVASVAALPPAVQASLGLLQEGEVKKADGGAAMRRTMQYAKGGAPRVPGPSFFQRDANRALSRQSGLIKSVVPGRTDKHPMRVASGSYILPADVVSHLGQNNTLSGAKFLRRKFGGGGVIQFASGGNVPMPVDIVAAGGEYVLSPDQVAAVGGGDLKKGHAALDKMVLDTRRDHIKTLRKLAPPKRS